MPPILGTQETEWTTWKELGSTRQTSCEWMHENFVDFPFHEEIQAVPFIYLFGLTVPHRLIGENLVAAALRQKHGFIGVALESDFGGEKKLNLDVCTGNAVLRPPPGLGCTTSANLTLWVAVTNGIESMQSIEGFLEKMPEDLPARYVQLCSFQVGRIKDWIGKNLKENRIRADHNINILFICAEVGMDEDSKDVIKRTENGVILFPNPYRPLRASDKLMVLRPDTKKLEVVEGKMVPGTIGARDGKRPLWSDISDELVIEVETKLRPDHAATVDQRLHADRCKGMVLLNKSRRTVENEIKVKSEEPAKIPAPKRMSKKERNPDWNKGNSTKYQENDGCNPTVPWDFTNRCGLMPQVAQLPWTVPPMMPINPALNPMMVQVVAAQHAAAYAQAMAVQAAAVTPYFAQFALSGAKTPGSSLPTVGATGNGGGSSATGRRRAAKGSVDANDPAQGVRPPKHNEVTEGKQSTSSNLGVAGSAPRAWSDLEPFLNLNPAEQQELHGKARKHMEEKPKAIQVLCKKQQIVTRAYARSSEENRTLMREQILKRVLDFCKDECGCLLVKLLLGKPKAASSWEDLHFGVQQDLAPVDIKPGLDVYTTGPAMDSVSMLVVGLQVPTSMSGRSVRDLRLRETYGFSAVAAEFNGELDVRMQWPLAAGTKLWVGFEHSMGQQKAVQAIRSFVGVSPATVPTRLLTLGSFSVDERPEWFGNNLMQTRIRNKYDVSVLGIIPGRVEGRKLVNVNDIVCFPKPEQMLSPGDRLLVLYPDLQRLEGKDATTAGKNPSEFAERLAANVCGSGANTVLDLAKDKNGCHVIQEALRGFVPKLKQSLIDCLLEQKTALLEQVIKSQHGIHVIKECLFQAYYGGFEPRETCANVAEALLVLVETEAGIWTPKQKFLPSGFLGVAGSLLDKKKFSYRLVLWLIEYFSECRVERIQSLLDRLADNTEQLIVDNNGSIVLSSVLEFGEAQRERVFETILSRMDTDPIPKHWYPSFLIDKLIIDRKILNSLQNGKARLLQMLCRNGNLERIQAHRSGGYMARRVYDELCQGDLDARRELLKVCPRLEADVDQEVGSRKTEKKADFNFNDSLFCRQSMPA